jgi:hypothetical protein
MGASIPKKIGAIGSAKRWIDLVFDQNSRIEFLSLFTCIARAQLVWQVSYD